MEVTDNSQFNKPESYYSDLDEYDDLPEKTKNYLESLGINKTSYTVEPTDDVDLSNLPSTSKISMISENQTTENFFKEFQLFYCDMMGKVKGLKTIPALNKTNYEETELSDDQLYGNLKSTPEIQEQIDAIKKLDDEIKSVITEYESEKSSRLETQMEMCNAIANNKYAEKDADLFLSLCNFEFSDKDNDKNDNVNNEEGNEKETTENKNTNSTPKRGKNFITRNISFAKEGVFANFSLTDEEKVQLEEILQDEEETQDRQQRSPFTLPSIESGKAKYFTNAYLFSTDDKKKIDDINSELEKFNTDEKKSEKSVNIENPEELTVTKSIDDLRKLNQTLLNKRLKKLEDRLKEIHAADSRDLEKLRKIREETQKNLEEDVNSEDFPKMDFVLDFDNLSLSEPSTETLIDESIEDELKEENKNNNTDQEDDLYDEEVATEECDYKEDESITSCNENDD